MSVDKAKNRSRDASMPERLYIAPAINTNKSVKDAQFHPHFGPMNHLTHNSVLQVINNIQATVSEEKNLLLHECDEYVCGCGCDYCCGCGFDL